MQVGSGQHLTVLCVDWCWSSVYIKLSRVTFIMPCTGHQHPERGGVSARGSGEHCSLWAVRQCAHPLYRSMCVPTVISGEGGAKGKGRERPVSPSANVAVCRQRVSGDDTTRPLPPCASWGLALAHPSASPALVACSRPFAVRPASVYSSDCATGAPTQYSCLSLSVWSMALPLPRVI